MHVDTSRLSWLLSGFLLWHIRSIWCPRPIERRRVIAMWYIYVGLKQALSGGNTHVHSRVVVEIMIFSPPLSHFSNSNRWHEVACWRWQNSQHSKFSLESTGSPSNVTSVLRTHSEICCKETARTVTPDWDIGKSFSSSIHGMLLSHLRASSRYLYVVVGIWWPSRQSFSTPPFHAHTLHCVILAIKAV